jgi:C4-dicarboxylate transporter, DctM subunit
MPSLSLKSCTGYEHIPVGRESIAACSVAKVSVNQIVKSLLPFVGLAIFCLMLMTYGADISRAPRDWVDAGAVW